MDGQSSAARGALQAAVQYWSDFVARCVAQRLPGDRFQDFVQLVHARHPLPPVLVADFFLRPQPANHVSLDPRIPPYIQALTQLGYVDAPSILRVLYKYSALHAHEKPEAAAAAAALLGKDGSEEESKVKEEEKGAKEGAKTVRWKDSSWAEEVMFYHVIRTMVEGTAFTDSKAGLELVVVVCQWMELFIHVSALFTSDMMAEKHDRHGRDEMETARAAFVPLLLRLVDNHALLRIISKPFAKGKIVSRVLVWFES